jgi:hypothetical protein
MWVDYDVPNRFPTLIMMSRIYSWHSKISSGQHFQNGHHNTVQIQHCQISTPFHMWVDYDVPNWFLTSKKFYRSPLSQWLPQYCTNSALFDFNKISYVGRLWCPEFYWSPFSQWPPQYRKNSTLFDCKGSFWFIYRHFVCYWFAVYLYFLAPNLSQCKVFI